MNANKSPLALRGLLLHADAGCRQDSWCPSKGNGEVCSGAEGRNSRPPQLGGDNQDPGQRRGGHTWFRQGVSAPGREDKPAGNSSLSLCHVKSMGLTDETSHVPQAPMRRHCDYASDPRP